MPRLQSGEIQLDSVQAHHARDVLRLSDAAEVEVFDDAGATAAGILVLKGGKDVAVRVHRLTPAAAGALRLTVASAVPKGERADWMVEKLSELGVWEFVPLAAERSVVLPGGKNKRERWSRIAIEAAKQSRRAGIMRIGELTPPGVVIDGLGATTDMTGGDAPPSAWWMTTASGAVDVATALEKRPPGNSLTVFIGPEGGWTEQEGRFFGERNVLPVRLTNTVLRVETAAVAVAAIVGAWCAEPPNLCFDDGPNDP